MKRGTLVTALTVAALTPNGAAAQERAESRGSWGLSFVAAQPVGELALFFDRGFGG